MMTIDRDAICAAATANTLPNNWVRFVKMEI